MSKRTSLALAKPAADVAEIRRALDLLTVPGGVVEIRALKIPGRGKPHGAAGYFLDRDKATQAAAALDARKAGGVYLVLNEINPDLLARSPDRATDHLDPLTGDGDIIRRRWLPLDFDPTRPAGISATEDEHCNAEDVARTCAAWLSSLGWPAAILADSGNGAHLLFRIDLPNDETSTTLVRDAIAAVAERFTGGGVDVDLKVFNAGRVWKVYGTSGRKGHDMPDRPHRVARLVNVPSTIQVVTQEQLEALAAMVAKPAPRPSTTGNGYGQPFTSRLDVPRWLTERGQGFKVKDRPDQHGRTVYILDVCPFDSSHGGGGEVSVMQGQGGALAAACMHNSCAGKGWQHFKEAIGKPDRDHYDPPLSDHEGDGHQAPASDRAAVNRHDPDEQDEPKRPRIPPPCCLRQLVKDHPTLRPAVIDGLLRMGETMNLVAAPKGKKSWLVNSLALSTVAGGTWLDRFRCTRGRVLILDAELHPEVIAHRLLAAAAALTIEAGYQEFIDVVSLRGKGIDLFDLEALVTSIKPGRYVLVILDAWYRFLPSGMSENDNAQVMALYNRIDGYTSHLNAAWVNVHHASKGDQSSKSATDVGSGAGSQSRAADTHLIIRQHREDNVAVVDAVVRSWPPVDRFCIRWEYPAWQLAAADPRKLWVPPSARDRAKENRDAHQEEDRQVIVNAMHVMAEPQTKTFIRDSSVGNPRFGCAWASLITDKTVVSAGIIRKGNNRPYEGFILNPEKGEQ
jgi:hypothetical protein